MGRVEITSGLNASSAFARQIEQMTAKKAAKVLDDMTDEIEREADRLIGQMLVTDRPGFRRKKGQRHLQGSIVATRDSDTFPMTIGVRSTAEKGKVYALEFGAGEHAIWAVDADALVFPSTGGRSTTQVGSNIVRNESGASPGTRGRTQGYGNRSKTVRTPAVWHPGNRAYGFLAKSLDTVIQRRLRNSRL
jgi:hypothetical protein